MANGDDLKIGGMKDFNLATSGMAGADNTSAQVTMPNNFYNTGRTSQTSETTRFLQYTAQHATVSAKSTITNFDFKFGTTSGLNPYTKLAPDQGNKLHTIG